MPEAQRLDDICPKHDTPMIKHLQHVGGGNSKWSEPLCPLCDEQEKAKADAAAKNPAPAKAAEPAAKPVT